MIPGFLKRFCLALMLAALMGGLLAGPARADGGDDDKKKGNKPVHTATSLRAALLYGQPMAVAYEQAIQGQRSVPLAVGLSAVVPGLGQAYNKQWIKAGIVVAVEVALIAGYSTWHSQGVDGRDAYQAFAHNAWSPLRYAQWLNGYVDYLETELGTPIAAGPIEINDNILNVDYQNPDSWTSEQALFVRSLILQIRAVESNVYHPETGASFSHKLPFFGEQQYYELVGKYFQFAPGWDDYPAWVDENGNFIPSIDPEMTASDGSKPNVSDTFFRYAEDHGQANDYLRRASRVSLLFVVNHLISAVDAAIFAKMHNNRLQTSVQMSQGASGELQPVASVRVKL
ncbi:MAG: hypothetical protein IH820_09145 [Bacteroidetes bacterium]|nr:hypothetical protein [Bacteroidota bacterium]